MSLGYIARTALLWLCVNVAVPAGAQIVFAAPAAPAAPPVEVPDAGTQDVLRELWTGTLYTATFRIGVCVTQAGDLRGVVLLRHSTGAVDVYHIYGRVDNGVITARHSSGHVFDGHFDGDNRVKLTVTLKGGRVLQMDGDRIRNPDLRPDTCRPLE